jgi:protein-disulfide isomerase
MSSSMPAPRLTSRSAATLAIVGLGLIVAGTGIFGRAVDPSHAAGPAAAAGGALGAGDGGTVLRVQAPAAAGKPASSNAAGLGEADVQRIIRKYLLENPEIMIEVQQALEAKMEKRQAEQMKNALKTYAKDIFRSEGAPFVGSEKGDVTVVEFFDYNCGYCKRALGPLIKLVEKDPKVKVVFKELPILSRGSVEATQVALAAKLQGKYWEAHRALLAARGQLDKASSLRVVEKLGLDMAKLRKDMDSPAVKAEIDRVKTLAEKMGIRGTPYFLVGDRMIPGAPENLLEQMSELVAEVRKTGCQVC